MMRCAQFKRRSGLTSAPPGFAGAPQREAPHDFGKQNSPLGALTHVPLADTLHAIS
jgi:hypothetical protein